MDEVSKYRLTGAIIWLLFLVILVPIWFGEPVDFKPEVSEPYKKTVERPLVKPEATAGLKLSGFSDVESKKEPSQWIVRVVAYKDIKRANDILGRLDGQYDVGIKTFEKTGVHSVRVGPFYSEIKAKQAKQEIDEKLYTQSEVVQLN